MTIITRLLSLALVVVCGGSIWSTNASAQGAVQASIAGVVRDTSGAVLPGVTIEAATPVLIEKSRSAVTYGATWGRPQSVLDARFAKLSAQIDF